MKKLIEDLFDRLRPLFEDKGPLVRFKSIFDAGEAIHLSPLTATACAPHVRDPLDVKRFMSTVIVALIPSLAAAVYFFGPRVLVMLLVSYAAGAVVEVGSALIRKEEINEGFLVTGFIFPLILPPGLPLWMVAMGIMAGVLIGKELFGGTGRNLFNPALVGRCFLALGYPAAMSGNWIKPGSGTWGNALTWVSSAVPDAVSTATPLILAKQGILAALPDLLTGKVAGCVGETSAIAVTAGGLFLLLTGVASWRTVAGILAGAGVLAFGFHFNDPARFTPVLWQLSSGGLLFGAFFMATDPVTGPATNAGRWIYGILIGAVTFLIRNFTGYVEGMMFAILLGNICAPVLDEVFQQMHLKGLQNEK